MSWRLGRPQSWAERDCRREELLPRPRIETRTVHTVVSYYTDYILLAQNYVLSWWVVYISNFKFIGRVENVFNAFFKFQ